MAQITVSKSPNVVLIEKLAQEHAETLKALAKNGKKQK
jgi:hypothetical protein